MAVIGMMPVVRMHQRRTLWVLCCATTGRVSEVTCMCSSSTQLYIVCVYSHDMAAASPPPILSGNSAQLLSIQLRVNCVLQKCRYCMLAAHADMFDLVQTCMLLFQCLITSVTLFAII